MCMAFWMKKALPTTETLPVANIGDGSLSPVLSGPTSYRYQFCFNE